MPIFITHGRYTAAAVKGMVEHAQDRAEAMAVTSTTGSRSPPRTMPLIRTLRSSGAATGQRRAGSGSGAPITPPKRLCNAGKEGALPGPSPIQASPKARLAL